LKNSCSVQVDLDSFATLLHFYNYRLTDRELKELSIFYPLVISRFLDLFRRLDIKATFFVAGWDVEGNPEAAESIKLLSSQGHEVASHSYAHQYNFTCLNEKEIESDIQKNSNFIENITGLKPLGFKTPGCCSTAALFAIISRCGFLYDSSVAPSFIYEFWKRMRSISKHNEYRSGKSDFISLISPRIPYRVSRSIWRYKLAGLSPQIIEMPFSCLPFTRVPFYSNSLFMFGENAINRLCYSLLKRNHLIFFMHGIDLVDLYKDNVDIRLRAHPFVSMPLAKKIKHLEVFLQKAKGDFIFKRSDVLAREILNNNK